ncbi:MAG: calcium-binding EGF-like domain-containing protein [Saprospiraceae bacterium]|nr:calcium-binding EGF-like domain-containing protein [Saprospiraceae bacterium]MDW8484819.1 calcium-binding EGF-like domain-containing protein [Saprospiraceae bacterium]
MNKNRFYLLVLLGVLLAFAPSCNTDPCKDVNCSNNGTCLDGECVCDTGYEGKSCETEWAVKFEGSYLGFDKCGNTTYNLSKPAVISKRSATVVRITNFGGFDSFIDAQVTKSNELSFSNYEDPARRRFTGSATISGKKLSGSYTVRFSDGSTESCTFEYTKQ